MAAAAPADAAATTTRTSFVVKTRKGKLEPVNLSLIQARLEQLAAGLTHVNVSELTLATVQTVLETRERMDFVSTQDLDAIAAELASARVMKHPDYDILAGRIAASNHQKNAPATFTAAMRELAAFRDPRIPANKAKPMLRESFMALVARHGEQCDAAVRPERDLQFNHFGFHTLARTYLMKAGSRTVETPQYLYMRVALALFGDESWDQVLAFYNRLSTHTGTMATPTMFNAGRTVQQLSSCILMTVGDDSLAAWCKTNTDVAMASKNAAGVGMSISVMRAEGAYISTTGGDASGVAKLLKLTNATTVGVNQGGKRPGRVAVYTEMWHRDVQTVVDLRLGTGTSEERARELFQAVWVPDEFMRRVCANTMWTLMCPSELNFRLDELHGAAFDYAYAQEEKRLLPLIEASDAADAAARKAGLPPPPRRTLAVRVRARELFNHIMSVQFETGMPYILFKDHANRTSNQQNLGTIKSSNLCAEIVEYTAPDEIAVCNLASLSLPAFVKDGAVDFVALEAAAYDFARALDRVIDINDYPMPEARRSNMRHRPVGLGVQGLADVFAMLRLPYGYVPTDGVAYEDHPSVRLNKEIFAAVYHGAIRASNDLSYERGVALLAEAYASAPETAALCDGEREQAARAAMDGLPAALDAAILRRTGAEPTEAAAAMAAETELRSMGLAGAYQTFEGSPASGGLLQFDLWQNDGTPHGTAVAPDSWHGRRWDASAAWDWAALKRRVQLYGLRNSLSVALMPTVSTATILGNNESFQPFNTLVYERGTLAGNFVVWNRHMVRALEEAGLWNDEVSAFIREHGSIADCPGIPEDIKLVFRTAREIKNKPIIDLAADRGRYVCQSQSMNLYACEVDPLDPKASMKAVGQLWAAIVYAWRSGLPTGKYYLHTTAVTKSQVVPVSTTAAVGAPLAVGPPDAPAAAASGAGGDDAAAGASAPTAETALADPSTVETVASAAPSRVAACQWRPPGSRPDDECVMCSA